MALASIADLEGPREEVDFRIKQAEQLSEMYDRFIDTEEDGHDRAPGIHASELYPCERKAVYSVTNVEKRPRVVKYWKQRFKMGQAVHLMVQQDFHRMAKRRARELEAAKEYARNYAELSGLYMQFEDEVRVHPDRQQLARDYNIHSACDGVFSFYEELGQPPVLRVGLEIKTESPDGYKDLKEPKFEHIRQTHIYMACLDVPLMWFFYMNKGNQNNTSSKAPYLIKFNHTIWSEVESRMAKILDYAHRGELPERTEFIGCEFCPWGWTCQPSNLQKIYGQQSNKPSRKETIRT